MVNGKYEYHRMGIGTSAGMQAAEQLHALLVSFPPTRLVCYDCFCCHKLIIVAAILNFSRELSTWHTVTNVTGRGGVDYLNCPAQEP